MAESAQPVSAKAGRPTIYVFGNPLLEQDSVPLRLLPKLRNAFPNIDFIDYDPSDNLHDLGKELTIIDTVQGIGVVTVIEDLGRVMPSKAYSLHDFDLGQNLLLLRKLGMLEKARIIGVPMGMADRQALAQVKAAIMQLFTRPGHPS